METDQCDKCGRVGPNHRDKLKGHQRADAEDRCAAYREWRWKLGGGCYVSDVDQVEWRSVGGEMRPVAVLELSRVDGNLTVPPLYLEKVVSRFTDRDAQGKMTTGVAMRLGVPAFIVLFRWNLEEFWVYSFEARLWSSSVSRNGYERWLRSMGDRKGDSLESD